MSEYINLTGITRKATQTTSKYDTINPDIKRGRETHDCNGRHSAHTGRSCYHAQVRKVHSQAIHTQRHASRCQGWWPLQSVARRSRLLYNQEQHQERRQIKIASGDWLSKMNNSAAVRFLPLAWKTREGRNPSTSYLCVYCKYTQLAYKSQAPPIDALVAQRKGNSLCSPD